MPSQVGGEGPGLAGAALPAAPSFDQKDLVNSSYNRWLFGAAQEESLETSDAENRILQTLSGIAGSPSSGAELVRRMPGLIPQLLQSLRSDTFAGADIARKISNDVVLVAAVIRLANGAMPPGAQAIDSVEHAVIVIGQEGLRQLITTVAFKPIIDLNSGHYTKLLAPRIWEQSERCAVANRVLAQQLGVAAFDAFLAGLVQNAGLLVSLRMMDQEAGAAKDLGSPMFCARLLRDARRISAGIAQEWHFPPAITQAIRELDTLGKGASLSAMGRVLSLGDHRSKLAILAGQGLGTDAGLDMSVDQR
ncbi:HDOD domain-containing protein [Pseudoduganella sp. LjRoot289]|uniref:HDOD domain-containing protein n=1 Tax=Pseudoduganella sp. LjRoot289 TaxID=3342314 RepID=UPI003ECFFEC8